MAPFLFQCPNTGLNVQGWSAEEIPADSESYLTLECLAWRGIAAELNNRGIQTPRGKGEWQAGTVSQLLARM
jgi:Recombinase